MEALGDKDLRDLELRSERLLLRRWQPDDAARVHGVMRDRSMHDYLTVPDPYTVQDADEFVARLGHEGRDDGTGLGCAVVARTSGEVVGSAALRLAGMHPEIGFWIAPDARGHGYAAEVTATLADFGFGLGLRRIGLFCDVRNLSSARSAMRAGFRFEGVLRDGAPAAGRGPADAACFGRLPGDPAGAIAPMFAPLPTTGLSDGTVTLRATASQDGPGLYEGDDELTMAVGFGGPRRSPVEWQRVADRAGLDWLTGRAALWTIVDTGSGRFAGGVTLRQSGPPGVGGIGYVVHPAFRGHGYATRALRLLAPWAFAHGFARLELGAKVDNVASQRAALTAGFVPDGVRTARLRGVDGGFSDEARFALLPAQLPTPETTTRPDASDWTHPGAQPE